MRKALIVAGIGTGVGKTVASAVLCRALDADYWKPVACGSSDSQVVDLFLGDLQIHPESYALPDPLSPHEAAARAGVVIEPFALPESERLVIEMAGGIFAPLSDELLSVDRFRSLAADWVVVVSHYLGSINHSLLTLEALATRGISCLGLIICGERSAASERVICRVSGLPIIGVIDREPCITRETINRYGEQWKQREPWKTLRA